MRAILSVLAEKLGDKWRPEVATAWESVYKSISLYMMNRIQLAEHEAAEAKARARAPPSKPSRCNDQA